MGKIGEPKRVIVIPMPHERPEPETAPEPETTPATEPEPVPA